MVRTRAGTYAVQQWDRGREEKKKRYAGLNHQQSTCRLNFLILDSCKDTEISFREALAISMVQPKANGNELKHFTEQMERKKRNRPAKARARTSYSSKAIKGKADLRLEREQWGMEANPHANQLGKNMKLKF